MENPRRGSRAVGLGRAKQSLYRSLSCNTERSYMTETSEQTPSKRRVIVVDDEQVIANALAIILNKAGFEARAVFCGEQAIQLGIQCHIRQSPRQTVCGVGMDVRFELRGSKVRF